MATTAVFLLGGGECIRKPLHCLVEAVALDGGRLENLERSVSQHIQTQLLVHLGDGEGVLHVLLVC